MKKNLAFLWFILGLGYKLQVVASLSITEIIVLVSAPFIFVNNHQQMRRDGIMPFFLLSLLVVMGCIVASIANKTAPMFVIRGMAATCLISCSIIFAHWILRRDPAGFKWMILALPLSALISTFYFKAAVEVSMVGESAKEIMSGPTFWISRLGPFIMAPIKGWYLRVPLLYSASAPIAFAIFAMLATTSGRSAALGSVAFTVLVIVGGKSRKSMSKISRNFWLLCIGGAILIPILYIAYKASASQGLLGEESQKKYEVQTQGGQGGIGRLLVGGRAESFIGLLACRDKPIIGWGPWAMDENGYTEEFMFKYGTWEDVQSVVRSNQYFLKQGFTNTMIQCHSYVTEFWLWYGIFGLVFWLYVIFVLLRYLKQDIAAVPQWFAWLACSIPGMLWSIFFSPFADRFGVSLFVVACLMARAFRQGRVWLPLEMIVEIDKVDRNSNRNTHI